MMQELALDIPARQSELDLPPSDDVRINDTAPVMRAGEDGIELVPMNFSFPPAGPRGGPVFNFRSEGRRFGNSNRCLIPASAFFEFTGKKYPKTKHRFTLNRAPLMAIAGTWREGHGNHPPAFTMLTTAPGRMSRRITIARSWCSDPKIGPRGSTLTKPENELLRPLAAGALAVQTVREGRA